MWSLLFLLQFFILNNLLDYKCFTISPLLFFNLLNLTLIFLITICFVWYHFLDLFSYNFILLGFFFLSNLISIIFIATFLDLTSLLN